MKRSENKGLKKIAPILIILAFVLIIFFWFFLTTSHKLMGYEIYLSGLQAGFESATYKVRQDYVFPADRQTWQIKSAKNEFEPFQLVLKSNTRLDNVDIAISDFNGPGKINKGNVTIFWVGYVNVTTRSSYDGQTGEWPDILVPKVDAYYREKRNSFPFQLNASRVQPIWFDVFVPANALPGIYQAKINATRGGSLIFEGNVTLEVWNFALPATSSMLSQFSLNGDALWTGFYYPDPPNWEADITDLMRMYIRAGLRHRITFSPRKMTFGDWNETKLNYENLEGSSSKVSDKWFNKTIFGFMGDGNPQVEYGNSRLTTLMTGFSNFYSEEIERNYGGCIGAPTTPPAPLVVRARKTAELIYSVLTPQQRAIYYVLPLDEPGGGEMGCGSENPGLDYNSSTAMAREIHAAGLKTYVTKSRRNELLNVSAIPPRNDFWDMWVPYFNNVVGRDWDGVGYNYRSDYNTDISRGAKLLWYESCMTHGCGSFGGHELDGNPQYGLEYPAIFARIFPWSTFKYDVHGEGYYAAVLDLTDPWYSQWHRIYYTNGEGNFFYPGLVNAANNGFSATSSYGNHTPSIGGTHDIPIESIRLKMIREGYEDYEYFYKLKQMGNDAYAKEQVSRAVVTTYNFTKDYNVIYSARENVARAILNMPPNPCGNGVIETGETCDDGDTENSDGCSSSCAVESGWTCTGQPSVCTRISNCIDSDNDKYNTTTGGACGTIADCDDNNPALNVLRSCNYNGVSCGTYSLCVASCPAPPAESCSTPGDDNCDGLANEGCGGGTSLAGLKAEWLFNSDFTSSKIALDTSGNGNSGTINGTTWASSGKYGAAAVFDGVNDFINLSRNPIDLTKNNSLCMWVKIKDITGSSRGYSQTFINLYTDANNGIRIGNGEPSGLFYVTYRSNGVSYSRMSDSAVFSNNIWKFVCYVFNGTIALYVDGNRVSVSSSSFSIGTENIIGGRDRSGGFTNGTLDDMRIFNRTLSVSEINDLFNNRIGGGVVCGNGVIETGETCDDGDTENSDGCSSSCAVETGWTCTGQPSVCTRTSTCIDSDNDKYNTTTGGACGTIADCDDNNPALNVLRSCNYNGVSCGTYSLCVASCPAPPAESCSTPGDDDCDGLANEGCASLPVLTVTSPVNKTYFNKVQISYSATGAVNCWYVLDGARTNTACTYSSFITPAVGSHIIIVYANNNAGSVWEARNFTFSKRKSLFTDGKFIRGDANDDGKVDISDGNYLLTALFMGGETPVCMDAADTNDDGRVDNSDAMMIFSFLFMAGKTPPAPYPLVGIDPTPDTLGCG